MLDVSYPTLRAFFGACHACGLSALELIRTRAYGIDDAGRVFSIRFFGV